MEEKKNQYEADEIVHLTFDDGVEFDCGIMGVFPFEGKEFIALEALDGSEDVYLYGYQETEDDFELLDIETQEEFERVSAEFERLMDEPL